VGAGKTTPSHSKFSDICTQTFTNVIAIFHVRRLATMERLARVLPPLLLRLTLHSPFLSPFRLIVPLEIRPAHCSIPFRCLSTQTKWSIKKCPECGSLLQTYAISCDKCGALNSLPENINYLSLFGFRDTQPFNFDLDVGALKKEYLKLMSKVHPDSVSGQSKVCCSARPFLISGEKTGS